MIYVPIGYASGKDQTSMDQVKGGSPYGSGTISGLDYSKTPNKKEMDLAKFQGKYFAEYLKKIKN